MEKNRKKESLRLRFKRLWTCHLAGPFSFGKDIPDKRDWASSGKCGRGGASVPYYEPDFEEIRTLLGHLTSLVQDI